MGASSTIIDVGIFWLLIDGWHTPPLLANTVSYSVGAINSFLLNKLITFRDRATLHSPARQLVTFVMVETSARLAVSSTVLALALPFMSSLAAKAISIVVTFILAYTLSSRLVFR